MKNVIRGLSYSYNRNIGWQDPTRARKDLHQWMHNRCGLVNTANPCRCPKKTKGFIQNGWVSPESLKWHSNYS